MDELWLEDCFVVKYEHDGQPGLGSHADDSELSFNLLLSEPGVDFEGGQLYVQNGNDLTCVLCCRLAWACTASKALGDSVAAGGVAPTPRSLQHHAFSSVSREQFSSVSIH